MGRAPSPASAKAPPCAMCGDPASAKMQTHAEDYARPFKWEPPAAYPVCVRCHSRLHKRFDAPERWRAYLAFLRRGWYAREITGEDLNRLAERGEASVWKALPHDPPPRAADGWWWETLTLDKASLTSPRSRLRG